MNKTQRLIALVLIVLVALACNLPSGVPTESPVPGVDAGSASPTVTETATPTATGVPPTACLPTVTTNVDANVRNGPGQVYGILGQLLQGTNANVAGKNAEGTWWYIEFAAGPNGHAWIAGSVTTAICIPDNLPIIAAPPTPIIPTNTPTYTPTPTSTLGLIFPIFPIFPIYSATPTPTFIFILPPIIIPNP
jgi:hypothetical protein